MFLGQILHANTNIGNKFNSPTNYNITESPKQKNLSSIPHYIFFLVTNGIALK